MRAAQASRCDISKTTPSPCCLSKTCASYNFLVLFFCSCRTIVTFSQPLPFSLSVSWRAGQDGNWLPSGRLVFFFIARQVFPCHWARPPFGPKGDRTRRETVPALSALAAAPPSRPPLFQAPGKLRFSLPKAGKDEGLRPPHPLPAALQRAVAFRESCVSGQLVRESPISARTRPCAQRRGRLRPSVRAPARLRLRVPQPL